MRTRTKLLLALQAVTVAIILVPLLLDLRSDPGPDNGPTVRDGEIDADECATPWSARRPRRESSPDAGVLPWQATPKNSPAPPAGQVAAWELDPPPPRPAPTQPPEVQEPPAHPPLP